MARKSHNYGAYMADLPCKNPNCKSKGKPHPNCKCYQSMRLGFSYAEGGVVEDKSYFCDSDRYHQKDCEYFSDGGFVNDVDHSYAIAGYLMHHGLHGILKMHDPIDEDSLDKYHQAVKKGHKALDSHLDDLFEDRKTTQENKDKEKEAIHEWISKGGITNDIHHELYKQNDTQNFASGGEVKSKDHKHGVTHDHPVQHAYPEQNMMLQNIKGRASQYLSSLKPNDHEPKLAFDNPPDQTLKKKAYDGALSMAAHPSLILHKMQKGTIQPEDIGHFNSVHPELNDVLKKKMTEKIIKAQMEGKKPSYKTRQAMSMFMGTPLSGELTPQNIHAAQATFNLGSIQPQQSQSSPPKKTSALQKTSQAYLTADEAAASRQQKQ